MRRDGRRPEPRIIDPHTHPRQSVSLRVAALYLGLNERTVAARVEDGQLRGVHDGRVWQIAVADLIAYDARRRGGENSCT